MRSKALRLLGATVLLVAFGAVAVAAAETDAPAAGEVTRERLRERDCGGECVPTGDEYQWQGERTDGTLSADNTQDQIRDRLRDGSCEQDCDGSRDRDRVRDRDCLTGDGSGTEAAPAGEQLRTWARVQTRTQERTDARERSEARERTREQEASTVRTRERTHQEATGGMH